MPLLAVGNTIDLSLISKSFHVCLAFSSGLGCITNFDMFFLVIGLFNCLVKKLGKLTVVLIDMVCYTV